MDFTSDLGLGGTLAVHGADSDGAVTNADIELTDADGKRWSATVLTMAEIDRLMGTWQHSGECQGGVYFRVPDLLIVATPSEAQSSDCSLTFTERAITATSRVR